MTWIEYVVDWMRLLPNGRRWLAGDAEQFDSQKTYEKTACRGVSCVGTEGANRHTFRYII